MKATRKLIPALAMLIVSAVVMSSASFAWFTMSREVTATGIDVSVTAPDNLLIKGNDAGDDWTSAEDTQVAATLVPASTGVTDTATAAKTFYSVSEGVNGLVDATDGSLFDTTKLVAVTTGATNGGEGSFVDYVFKVKTDGENTTVYVKDFTLTDKNDPAPANSTTYLKPVRFALLAGTDVIGQYNAGEGTNLGDASDPQVIATNAVVKSLGTGDVAVFEEAAYTAANTTTTNFAVTKGEETTITIRVWYEGQDTNCTISGAKGAHFELAVTLAANA